MAITDKPTKNGPLSVNLDEILAKLVDQRCFKKGSFFTRGKLKKCLTNSVAKRSPSLGISFNSHGKFLI